MGLRLVPRLPIGDRTFKGNVGSGVEKGLNILPQLYRSISIMIASRNNVQVTGSHAHTNIDMPMYSEACLESNCSRIFYVLLINQRKAFTLAVS